MNIKEAHDHIVAKYNKKQWFRMAGLCGDSVIVYVANLKTCPSETELSNEVDYDVKIRLMKGKPKPA